MGSPTRQAPAVSSGCAMAARRHSAGRNDAVADCSRRAISARRPARSSRMGLLAVLQDRQPVTGNGEGTGLGRGAGAGVGVVGVGVGVVGVGVGVVGLGVGVVGVGVVGLGVGLGVGVGVVGVGLGVGKGEVGVDRKSTRLNSSHLVL